MIHVVWLLPLLPALAAIIGPLTDRVMPGGPVVAAGLGSLGALVFGCILLADQWGSPVTSTQQVEWAPIGGGSGLHLGTSLDLLSASLAVAVALVALLVQLYSSSYMAGDARYGSYAAEVSLFTAAMLLTVVSSSLIELLVGWEIMGICSYLLVGHYHQVEGSRAAAVKALVTTRIGDAGFLVGIIILGASTGSFDIATVNHNAHSVPHTTIVVAALLLLAGTVGKSAQFPLHVWLPDAMAGPTPISALIHAATMVAAGVFLVMRLYPVFLTAPISLVVLGVIACISMVGAALAAIAQDDLKRVLAYSTISQLGYMFAGLAVHGGQAAFYQLLGHALFKALLFLAAGSVLRAVGTNLMSEMGGLWRRMPITFVTAIIGAWSLAGIPPLPGSFGKAGIVAAAAARGGSLGVLVEVAALVTELLTAIYVTRMICRTFLGASRNEATVHESPLAMTGPLVVLSAGTIGFSFFGTGRLHDWLIGSKVFDFAPLGHNLDLVLPTVLALVGVAVVGFIYSRDTAADPLRVLGKPTGFVNSLLLNAFYVDAFYDVTIVKPVRRLATAVVDIDVKGIDATAMGSGKVAVLLGGGLRKLQTGNVQTYATGLIGGTLLLVLGVALAVAR